MAIKKDDLELLQKALEEEDRVSGCHRGSTSSSSIVVTSGHWIW